MAALICVKPANRLGSSIASTSTTAPAKGRRKGFTETDYAGLLDAAHQQLGGPIVVVWGNVKTHVSHRMRQPVDAHLWLTVYQLPSCSTER
ncbi:transposase [Streptomyces sp. NPDC059893]|uniref:transposase n=1 Tax=Streptomyces sp. NPDC059893 TaxID=3346990 RepID=UPI00365BAC03